MLSTLAVTLIWMQAQATPKDLPTGPQPTAFLSFTFSPDSKKVLYSKVDDAANFDPQKRNIWVADADGGNPKIVTSGVGLTEWARDGASLLYIKTTPTGNDLCRFDIATKKETSLGLRLFVRGAHCSPVTDQLVLMADVSKEETQCFTCTLDGKNVRQITFGPGKAYNPLWSADGKQIVFFRELGDGKDQVYVMNPDGGNLRRVSDPANHNFYPDFGPAGTVSHTLMMSEEDKTIVIRSRQGKLLSVFPYRTSRLRWSPDGKKAIFAVGAFPTMALYVSDVDGRNPKRIGESP